MSGPARNPSWMRLGFIAACFVALSGCGGGGGGSSGTTSIPTGSGTPAPAGSAPSATAEELANARNAELTMTLQARTKRLTISWVDRFSAETGYKVEARTADGAWQTVEALPAAASTGTPYQWQRSIDTSRNYRVTASHAGYSIPLGTPTGQTEIPFDLATLPMSLAIDQESPLTGIVQLSIANPDNAVWVDYYIDLNLLGRVETAPSFAIDWAVASVPDGNHLVVAQVLQGNGARVELSREVTVDNPTVAVVLTHERVNFGGRDLKLQAMATSAAGIQSVQFFVHNHLLQTVTTQTGLDTYVHVVDAATLAGLPSGPNIFKVIATDNDSAMTEVSQEISIDHPPLFSLTTPFDGAIVTGQLPVQGTFGDDHPGAVLTVTMGDLQIYQQSTPGAVDFDYPLNSLPGGEYTVTIEVADSSGRRNVQRMNVIVNTTPRSYALVARNAEVLATDQGALLYRKLDGSVIWRNASGAETTLQIPVGLANINWQLAGSHVVISANGPAPLLGHLHVYSFDTSGVATNISQPLGLSRTENPILRAPWLIWTNGGVSPSYSIYNLDTDAHVTVPVPVGAMRLGNWRYDFVTTPGNEQFFFWAATGGDGTSTTYDIYRYRLADGAIDVLTGGGSKQIYTQTDGTRVAWQKAPANQLVPPYELVVAPVSNPTSSTTLSSNMIFFALGDGRLAWLENTADPRVLKVDDGITTIVSSNAANVAPTSADGQVIFNESGKVHSWSRSGGKHVLLDALPARPIQQDAGIAFITTGAEQFSIYRVQL